MPLETRQEILEIIDAAKASGIARYTTCGLLQISIRRVERWEFRLHWNGSMAYEKPGPVSQLTP